MATPSAMTLRTFRDSQVGKQQMLSEPMREAPAIAKIVNMAPLLEDYISRLTSSFLPMSFFFIRTQAHKGASGYCVHPTISPSSSPPSVKSESCSLSSTFSLPPPPPELSTPHRPSLELRQPPELSLPRRTSLSLYTSSTSLPSPAVSFSTPHRPSLSLHLTDLLSHYTSPTFSLSTPHRPLFSLYTSPTFPPLAGLRLDAGILEIGDIVGCAQYLEFPLHAWVRIPLPHHRL